MRKSRSYGNFSAHYLGVLLVVVFSGAYLTKVGISPIYPFMGLGFILIFVGLLKQDLVSPYRYWFYFFIVIGILSLLCIYQISEKSLLQNTVNLILGPVAFFSLIIGGRGLSSGDLENVSRKYVYFALCLAIVECLYRLSHPDFSFLDDVQNRNIDVNEIAFYAYKFNSLMYLDSNFVGLQLVIVFAFMLALSYYEIYFRKATYFTLLTLIFLTLSRASIITSFAVLALFWFRRIPSVWKIFGSLFFVCLAYFIFLGIEKDGSFLTKLEILHLLADFLNSGKAENIFFGVGVGNASGIIGIGAHNILATYIIEGGLVFSMLVIIFWLVIILAVPGVIFLAAAWFINGFSLTSFAVPYLYVSAAVLWCLFQSKCVGSSLRRSIQLTGEK